MANVEHTSDILAIYTRDVARYRVLTPEEEREIGAKALKGDADAQEQLVRANLRFVITIAKRYRRHGVPLMDLIQAGNIGLAHAARKFNPEMGVRFISYAVFWISQQIQKEIDANDGSVRATQTQMVRLRRVRRLQAEARQKLGREYTVEELMELTGYTEARVREALGYRVTMKSLDEPVNPHDGSTTTLGQIIGHDDGREDSEREREIQDTVQRVLRAVLSDREREVLEEYHGFHGRREMSLNEIGLTRRVSRERARQLKERGLKKLRAATQFHALLREVFTTQAELDERRKAREMRAATTTVPTISAKPAPAEPARDLPDLLTDVAEVPRSRRTQRAANAALCRKKGARVRAGVMPDLFDQIFAKA
ncbi:MAG TPA: RNA polymerase sigma factor RpoD/SigA [Gemmatimonadaceae bacterium]